METSDSLQVSLKTALETGFSKVTDPRDCAETAGFGSLGSAGAHLCPHHGSLALGSALIQCENVTGCGLEVWGFPEVIFEDSYYKDKRTFYAHPRGFPGERI